MKTAWKPFSWAPFSWSNSISRFFLAISASIFPVSRSRKLAIARWFRLVFCLTDALGFEKAALRLVQDSARKAPSAAEHHCYPAKALNLRDICRLHEF